jgi:hypothetical protein
MKPLIVQVDKQPMKNKSAKWGYRGHDMKEGDGN